MYMRFYCIKKTYRYFKEYIESIKKNSDIITYFDINSKIDIIDDNHTNVFVAFIPNNIDFVNKNNNPVNIIFFNTEQITRIEIENNIIENMQKLIGLKDKYHNLNVSIMDYSNQNINILIKNNIFLDLNIDIHWVPYQYRESENKKLKFFSNNIKYDIAHCGEKSTYRNDILTNIKNNVKIINIVGWDDNRDKQIGNSLILINIHYNKSYNIYESIRCDRWLFSGKLILSETSINDYLLDVKDCIILCEYNNLVNMTNNILNNYKEYETKYITNNKRKLFELINNRNNIYKNFRNLYS